MTTHTQKKHPNLPCQGALVGDVDATLNAGARTVGAA